MEAEAMLIGTWKNVEDLEESLNLDELTAVIDKAREREIRNNKFMAAIQGIDLGEDSSDADRFDEIKRRVESNMNGVSQEQLELDELGFDLDAE